MYAHGSMMSASVVRAFVVMALLQAPPPATVAPQRFVGIWVGVQSWAIENPPPGARQDQPVTLTVEMVDGKLAGTLIPFMGGQDGATFTDAQIVGEELLASAVVGRPRPASTGRGPGVQTAPAGSDEGVPVGPSPGSGRSGRRGFPPGWKDTVKITFAFKNDGVNLAGTADVLMGDVKWLKFKYDLSKKRSRY